MFYQNLALVIKIKLIPKINEDTNKIHSFLLEKKNFENIKPIHKKSKTTTIWPISTPILKEKSSNKILSPINKAFK